MGEIVAKKAGHPGHAGDLGHWPWVLGLHRHPLPQRFPALHRSQQFIVDLRDACRHVGCLLWLTHVQAAISQQAVELGLLGLGLLDQAGQAVVFALLFEAEFFGRACFDRRVG